MKKLSSTLYEHLIFPIINNVAPVSQVSWAVAIGLFVGLTPTVGFQMWIIAAIWSFCRYLFRFRFYLPVGVAMVWVSNPLTVVPLYYLFFITGNFVFETFSIPTTSLGWEAFQQTFSESTEHDFWETLSEGSHYFLVELGLPTLTGSLVYAIPLAILFYFITHTLLIRYRKYKAEQENLTYEEWCLRYETLN